MNYREIYNMLSKYTDNFTKEVGKLPFEDKKEVETAKQILSNHYDTAKKDGLDWVNEDINGIDYVVSFDGPIANSEFDQGGLNYTPTVGSAGPMGVAVESLQEDIEKHNELNQELFDGDTLRPEVKDKILQIVDKFNQNLIENGIELDIKDVVIIGSNASYNYNKDSDIDTHIVADMSEYEGYEDLALKLYQAYKSLFNAKYDPTIRGFEVELYVEPEKIRANSNGQYSLYNGWLKVPEQTTIPDIDESEVESILEPYIKRYEEVDTISDIDQLIDDIYLERQQGILRDGEYSVNNIAFKEFRSRGYLKDLRKKKIDLENAEMSLESLNNMYEMLTQGGHSMTERLIEEVINEDTETFEDDREPESLSLDQIAAVEEICNEMIENIEPEVLEEIVAEDPMFSDEGVLSNDAFYEDERLFDADDYLIGKYAVEYIKNKLGLVTDELSDLSDDELNLESLAEMLIR